MLPAAWKLSFTTAALLQHSEELWNLCTVGLKVPSAIQVASLAFEWLLTWRHFKMPHLWNARFGALVCIHRVLEGARVHILRTFWNWLFDQMPLWNVSPRVAQSWQLSWIAISLKSFEMSVARAYWMMNEWTCKHFSSPLCVYLWLSFFALSSRLPFRITSTAVIFWRRLWKKHPSVEISVCITVTQLSKLIRSLLILWASYRQV